MVTVSFPLYSPCYVGLIYQSNLSNLSPKSAVTIFKHLCPIPSTILLILLQSQRALQWPVSHGLKLIYALFGVALTNLT